MKDNNQASTPVTEDQKEMQMAKDNNPNISDGSGRVKNNESSIRFVFDEADITDSTNTKDNKDYVPSVRSASITSSYSEIYNQLSFNPETSSSAEICAICIDHYQLNDELRKLPCVHEFHKDVKIIILIIIKILSFIHELITKIILYI